MTGWNYATTWETLAREVPDREAVVCGDRRLTFAELDRRAERLAHVLAAHGIGPGDAVAISLDQPARVPGGVLRRAEAGRGAGEPQLPVRRRGARVRARRLRRPRGRVPRRRHRHDDRGGRRRRWRAARRCSSRSTATTRRGSPPRPTVPHRGIARPRATTGCSSTPVAPPAVRRASSGGSTTTTCRAGRRRAPAPSRPTPRAPCGPASAPRPSCPRRRSCTPPRSAWRPRPSTAAAPSCCATTSGSTPPRCGTWWRVNGWQVISIVGETFARPLLDALDLDDVTRARPVVAPRHRVVGHGVHRRHQAGAARSTPRASPSSTRSARRKP